jgi:hypothetical protein
MRSPFCLSRSPSCSIPVQRLRFLLRGTPHRATRKAGSWLVVDALALRGRCPSFRPRLSSAKRYAASPITDHWATDLLRSPLVICCQGVQCLTDKSALTRTDLNFWVITAQRWKASIYRITWGQRLWHGTVASGSCSVHRTDEPTGSPFPYVVVARNLKNCAPRLYGCCVSAPTL